MIKHMRQISKEDNTKYEYQRFPFLEDVRPAEGTSDQSRRQQQHKEYDLSLSVIICTRKKAPAAHSKRNQNEVH